MSDVQVETKPIKGITLRSAIIAIGLTFLCGLWVRQAEIVVMATQVSESVPPIPALAVLMSLVALNPIIRLISKRMALSRQEILTIYCFTFIAVAFMGCGVIRLWLALITAPFYFANDSNQLATLFDFIPGWLAVKDPELIKPMYEGGNIMGVPWKAWMAPLTYWSFFFVALWICMLSLVELVRHRWVQSEKLTFPIVELPLEITSSEQSGRTPFFKNKLMWLGFGIAAAFNISNIANALYPAFPAIGNRIFIPPPVSPPWNAMGGITCFFRPELIGLGFLVPKEICFSIWAFYILQRIMTGIISSWGISMAGMPFEQEQGIGAYIVIGVWLLWSVRKDIASSFTSLFNKKHKTNVPTWALPGFIISYIAVVAFSIAAGMAMWVAVMYLGVVLLTALVYCRIRSEVGAPIIWLFPFYQQKNIFFNVMGSSPFLNSGMTTLTFFAMTAFLARGYMPELISYQAETLQIGDKANIKRSHSLAVIIAGILGGLAISYYIYLTTYYQLGAQNLPGIAMWSNIGNSEFTQIIAYKSGNMPPALNKAIATGIGGFTTVALLFLRNQYVGFPLHPIGYAVAASFGNLVWFSFFIVWLVKVIITKTGGIKLYGQAVPFFLGLTLGHFFVAGVLWGLIGAIWKDVAGVYSVVFG